MLSSIFLIPQVPSGPLRSKTIKKNVALTLWGNIVQPLVHKFVIPLFFPNLEHHGLEDWPGRTGCGLFQLLFLSHQQASHCFLKEQKTYFSETNYHSKIVYKSLWQCFWDSFICRKFCSRIFVWMNNFREWKITSFVTCPVSMLILSDKVYKILVQNTPPPKIINQVYYGHKTKQNSAIFIYSQKKIYDWHLQINDFGNEWFFTKKNHLLTNGTFSLQLSIFEEQRKMIFLVRYSKLRQKLQNIQNFFTMGSSVKKYGSF